MDESTVHQKCCTTETKPAWRTRFVRTLNDQFHNTYCTPLAQAANADTYPLVVSYDSLFYSDGSTGYHTMQFAVLVGATKLQGNAEILHVSILCHLAYNDSYSIANKRLVKYETDI